MTDLPISSAPRPLGKNGPSVFPIAYGMWRFAGSGPAEARAKLEAALDAGIELFDTADIYGIDDGFAVGAAEELFGAALGADPSIRSRMVIATKCGIVPGVPYDSTAGHIRSSCEASLRRMKIETIDLFQIHRPDLLTHPSALADVLSRLREEGKIRFIGVSNYTVSQTEALQAHLDIPIATLQPELSVLHHNPIVDGTLDYALEKRFGVLAWSPLAGGRLTLNRKQAKKQSDDGQLVRVAECLETLAEKFGTRQETVALAFLLAHPAQIIPIIGTQKRKRISRIHDVFDVKLTRADWYQLLQASLGEALP